MVWNAMPKKLLPMRGPSLNEHFDECTVYIRGE